MKKVYQLFLDGQRVLQCDDLGFIKEYMKLLGFEESRFEIKEME